MLIFSLLLNSPDGTSFNPVQFWNIFITVPAVVFIPLNASGAIVASDEQSANIEVKVFVFVVVPNRPAGTA